jgi:hypothetical protein
VLIAWLFVELARFMLGDLRFGRVQEGSLQVAAPESPAPPAPPPHQPPTQPAAPPRAEVSAPDRVLYDEVDVEQAIRDRLYGVRGRRRT